MCLTFQVHRQFQRLDKKCLDFDTPTAGGRSTIIILVSLLDEIVRKGAREACCVSLFEKFQASGTFGERILSLRREALKTPVAKYRQNLRLTEKTKNEMLSEGIR